MASSKKAAQEAIDVIIVDDGLQHYRLHHDLAILLIDSQYGFGNGRLLPAGPLRELPQDVKMDMQVAVGAKITKRILPCRSSQLSFMPCMNHSAK